MCVTMFDGKCVISVRYFTSLESGHNTKKI